MNQEATSIDFLKYKGAFESAPAPVHPPGTLIKQGAEARIYSAQLFSSVPKQCLVKERFVKKYRHSVLDTVLSLKRMRAEARQLLKCHQLGLPVPAVFHVDMKQRQLWLEDLGPNVLTLGVWIKLVLDDSKHSDKAKKEKLSNMAIALGSLLAKMHANQIIHGDLTTANLLIQMPNSINDFTQNVVYKLYIIDFGLSSNNNRSDSNMSNEEAAVDLYVLERALISSMASRDGTEIFSPESFFTLTIETYQNTFPLAAANRPSDQYCKQTKNSKSAREPSTIQDVKMEVANILKTLKDVQSRGRKRLMVG